VPHDEKDQADRARIRELETAETILKPMRDRAERAYHRVFTTLWVGNASAALATVVYITANRHDGTFTRSLLIPLVLFVVGLSVTGISSLIDFESERQRIAEMENASPAPVMPAKNVQSGLDRRTIAALVSGACFFVGFIFCFAILARN
jgi:hypothetical protein